MGNVDNGTRDNADSSKNYGKVKEDVSESNLLTHSWTATTTETWHIHRLPELKTGSCFARSTQPNAYSSRIIPTDCLSVCLMSRKDLRTSLE